MKIVVLHDYVPPGAPLDQMDNLVQAQEAADGLEALGHKVEMTAFAQSVEETAAVLKERKPDMVFNLVEMPLGQARLIHLAPLLLDRLGLAYTGAGTRAMLVTSNKLLGKKALSQAGLPTPDWVTPETAGRPLCPDLSYLVKSVWEHGSVGVDESFLVPGKKVKKVHEAMKRHMRLYGGKSFAEAYIAGREFNISVLGGPDGPKVLPPAEIIFENYGPKMLKVVGYRAKWVEDSYEFSHTPRCYDFPKADQPLLRRLRSLSLKSWRLFGLRGWARVDFRVDEKGKPWILEVNANPCLAQGAGFLAAAAQGGLEQKAVLQRILCDARAPAVSGKQTKPANR